jgi:tetratricopeptide (TPR) repeat protein
MCVRAAALFSRHPLACFAAISLIWLFLLYRNAFAGAFVYDDFPQIRDNPALLSWSSTFGYFQSAIPFSRDYLTTGGSFYRPLLWVSLAIDRHLWGLNPAGFHVTNLVLHWISCILLFALFRRTKVSFMACAVGCLMWAALPINTEVVAWISGRYIALFAIFTLSSVLLADEYASSRRGWLLAAYLFANAGAILSYEAGIVAFPLAMIWLYFHSKLSRAVGVRLGQASLAVYIVMFVLRLSAHAELPNGSAAILPVGASLFKYLAWILVPVHMSVERSTDLPRNGATPEVLIGSAGLLLALIATVYLSKKTPAMALVLSWIFVTLLPFCGIVPNYQGMAERYTYVASMGVVLAIVCAAGAASRRVRTWTIAALCIWTAWGAWRLNARVLDWRDEVTVDQASLAATPNSPVLLYNLGVAASQHGDSQTALGYYERAVAANPRHASALLNLAVLLRQQGRLQEALERCRQSIEANPSNASAWLDFGNIYGQLGSIEEAKNAYEKASALSPSDPQAALNLGAAYQRLGNKARAKQQYEFAISLDPAQPAAYCNLGALLFEQGDTEGAVHALNKAIEVMPSYATAYFDLGVIYQQRKMPVLAIEMFQHVLLLDPANESARRNLAMLQKAP